MPWNRDGQEEATPPQAIDEVVDARVLEALHALTRGGSAWHSPEDVAELVRDVGPGPVALSYERLAARGLIEVDELDERAASSFDHAANVALDAFEVTTGRAITRRLIGKVQRRTYDFHGRLVARLVR